jgi:hypothetical protein
LDAHFRVSLKVPYKKYPTTFTKSGFFYSASIPVNIARPEKNSPRSKRFDAIIDSGASNCLFHASIGEAIGLDIEKGELTQTMGIAGAMQIYLHEISLYAPGGIIATRAGFTKDLPIAGMLGINGFFENFRVTFDPIALRVELERLYQA